MPMRLWGAEAMALGPYTNVPFLARVLKPGEAVLLPVSDAGEAHRIWRAAANARHTHRYRGVEVWSNHEAGAVRVWVGGKYAGATASVVSLDEVMRRPDPGPGPAPRRAHDDADPAPAAGPYSVTLQFSSLDEMNAALRRLAVEV